MKKLLKLTFIILVLTSCKETSESKGFEGVMNEVTGKNSDVNEKYDLLLKELGTKTPLSDAELMEAFPKKIGNLNLDGSGNADPGSRVTSSNTVIRSFGDNSVRMEVLDAAGQNAIGALIPLKMLHLNTITSENNNTIRYNKKERNGILTFGTDQDKDTKADYQSELRFLYDDRFYITLQGRAMDTDELWDAISMDDLSRFKELNE